MTDQHDFVANAEQTGEWPPFGSSEVGTLAFLQQTNVTLAKELEDVKAQRDNALKAFRYEVRWRRYGREYLAGSYTDRDIAEALKDLIVNYSLGEYAEVHAVVSVLTAGTTARLRRIPAWDS